MNVHKNPQIIDFNNYDENCPTFIYKRDLIVRPSTHTKNTEGNANNTITSQNVVEDSWKDSFTLGCLISYHSYSKLLAYVLSISGNCMIRVLSEETSIRCLIKEFSDTITDVTFSRRKKPYVASIEISGAVKVFKIILTKDIIECQLVLHVRATPVNISSSPKISYSRVIWCCHSDIAEIENVEIESNGMNMSMLLGIAHGPTFEVLQVDKIESSLTSKGNGYDPIVDRKDLKLLSSSFQEQYSGRGGFSGNFLPYLSYTTSGESIWITCFALSNDATFAVGLQDGTVHFFTLEGSAPSGLKEAFSWKPFEKDVVWSLLFLDDCRSNSCTASLRSHVVVGGLFNRQLKLFRCDKWNCVQTITFDAPSLPCLMTAQLDQSAMFLIMSDARREAVYLLEIDSVDGGTTKLFKSVQEFVLTQPLLSLLVNSITSTLNMNGGQQVVINLFTITKSAFQKMNVTYISKGQRLNEIMMDGNEDEEVTSGLESHYSVLSKISSLPSITRSFQDIATINTNIQNNFPSFLNKLYNSVEAMGVPSTQRHLNLNYITMSKDISKDDFSFEYKDEILDPMAKNRNKFKNEEDCVFSSLCNKNGKYFNGAEYILGIDVNETKSKKNEDKIINRLEVMLDGQSREMEMLMIDVQNLKNQLKCNISRDKERTEVWSENTVTEINFECQKVITTLMSSCVKEVMETFISRIVGDIGGRVNKEVRSRMKTVESVLREFTKRLFNDEKFIGSLSVAIVDSLEKHLRDMHSDMIRQMLVPTLARTANKMLTDIKYLSKEHLRKVKINVEKNNEMVMKSFEEKLTFLNNAEVHKSLEMEVLIEKMMTIVTGSHIALAELLDKQNVQMSKMSEALQELSGMGICDCNQDYLNRYTSSIEECAKSGNISLRQKTINRLILSKDYAAAINEALSLTNLEVLINVCSQVKPNLIFSGSTQKQSLLKSSSILALIQQLSRDFHEHCVLKIEFLFDALLSLDFDDLSVRDHISKILKTVAQSLHIHMYQNCSICKDKIGVLLKLVTARFNNSEE